MITSPKNNRIKEAQKLRRKRNRDSTGLVLLEGVRLIEDALGSGLHPQILFYTPDLINDNPRAVTLQKQLRHQGVECLACTPTAFSSLADTVTPQGLIGIFPRPAFRLATKASLVLILDRVREPGNVGTLLRSVEAAGVDQVLIAPNTVDPYNEKVVRAAMGAHFRLPIERCPTWHGINDVCSAICLSGPTFYVADAKALAYYDSIDWRKPSAIIIGGEAKGASDDVVTHANPIMIPMHGAAESLNAAVAGSVILFEAARQRRSISL